MLWGAAKNKNQTLTMFYKATAFILFYLVLLSLCLSLYLNIQHTLSLSLPLLRVISGASPLRELVLD